MQKTNVIIIHTDQHRQECLGVYGNKDIKTPRIDAIAADGVLYDNHFCCFPVCTPSRYSLLSGMYASVHRGLNNSCTLPQGVATFAKELRNAGYRTAAVGKMHFTPTYPDAGFDFLTLAEQDGMGRFDDDYHKYLRDCGLLDEIDLYDQRSEYRKNAPAEYFGSFGAGCSDLACEHHSTTYITNSAVEQIGQFRADGGNLLMVGYIKPHHPFDPPEPYSSMYDPDSLTLLDGYAERMDDIDWERGGHYFDSRNLTENRLRTVMSQYYGAITHIDDGVGKIMDKLKEKGIYEDSLIIFTSDHGEYLGFRHLLLKGNFMYDPLVKIPLIIKYPASWQKTGVDNSLSSNIDIAKTILSVCGISAPGSMQAFDLTRELRREVAVCESSHIRSEYMARTKEFKLLVSDNFKSCRFFDLVNDPLETTDLSGDTNHKNAIAELKGLLVEEMMMHANKSAYRNPGEPLAGGLANAEAESGREAMIAYMREKSTVKPKYD
jgi:arylsulfatase A-like enzyme